MENNEEKIPANEITADRQEAQILDPERILEMPEEKPKKKKYDFYIELALFLILGILIGIAVKTEAAKKITIGFDDYKMKIMRSDFDINKIEKDILKKQAENAQNQEENNQINQ
jgi:hypothetical protein